MKVTTCFLHWNPLSPLVLLLERWSMEVQKIKNSSNGLPRGL
jgi:hypothetical protein